jgi:hypothetical protein
VIVADPDFAPMYATRTRKIKALPGFGWLRACGDRFRMAIYFHLDGLDLYPAPFTPRS